MAAVCLQGRFLLTHGTLAQRLCDKPKSGLFCFLLSPQCVLLEALTGYQISFCGAGHRTQDLTHAKQVLYLRATPAPQNHLVNVPVCFPSLSEFQLNSIFSSLSLLCSLSILCFCEMHFGYFVLNFIFLQLNIVFNYLGTTHNAS